MFLLLKPKWRSGAGDDVGSIRPLENRVDRRVVWSMCYCILQVVLDYYGTSMMGIFNAG